jgi:hypothetical protein
MNWSVENEIISQFFPVYHRTIIGLWKTKSSAIEQRSKLEEDREEDASFVDLDAVQAVLSIGDVPLSKEYTLEHPIDVREIPMLIWLPLLLTGFYQFWFGLACAPSVEMLLLPYIGLHRTAVAFTNVTTPDNNEINNAKAESNSVVSMRLCICASGNLNLGLSQADLLMGVFDGGALETRTMSRVGCLDYSATPWEAARPGVLERHVSYKFNRYMSIFGGEVVSTQFKFPAEDGGGWTIHDVVTLHNVPFGDYFRVYTRARHC